MRCVLAAVAALALVGCNSNRDKVSGDADTDTDTDSDIDYGNGDSNGPDAPSRAADDVWYGNLSDGEVVDMDWASTSEYACFPATELLNFNGAQWMLEVNELADHHLFVRITPQPNVDVSVYGVQAGSDTTGFPPELTPITCEAGADFIDDSNPGTAEVIKLSGFTMPYRVVIGVVGAGGATQGAFQVETWNEPI